MAEDKPLRLALDWLPNTACHTGIVLAIAYNFFAEEGVQTPELISPHVDRYKTTPAERITEQRADLALCPTESVLSSNDPSSSKVPMIAIAAVLQYDASSIASIVAKRPCELDHTTYASYGARFEGRLVKALIQADGGEGVFDEDTDAGMLGAFDAVLDGKATSTWIFSPWERIRADCQGKNTQPLREFKLDAYGVPYSYSPVIACSATVLQHRHDELRKLMRALSRGYQAAAYRDADQVAYDFLLTSRQLFPDLPKWHFNPSQLHPGDSDDDEARAFLTRSVHAAAPYILNTHDASWGRMDPSKFDRFVSFLHSKGYLNAAMPSRNPDGVSTFSLKQLREEQVGEAIDPALLSSSQIMTNELFD